MKCARCFIEVNLPFRCNYCGKYFCPEHRLPEVHECSEYWRVKVPRLVEVRESRWPPRYGVTQRRSPLAALRFSQTESKHIALGVALVSASGLSIFGFRFISLPALLLAVVFFTLGFILHELAHKLMAQNHGLWAEFRVDPIGALLTLISVLAPFKIIAPGAVMIIGPATRRAVGLTATVGPLMNVVLSITLYLLALIVPDRLLAAASMAGASVNAFMALFNLIPFGVLDGQKVFWWSKPLWGVTFAISLILVIHFMAPQLFFG